GGVGYLCLPCLPVRLRTPKEPSAVVAAKHFCSILLFYRNVGRLGEFGRLLITRYVGLHVRHRSPQFSSWLPGAAQTFGIRDVIRRVLFREHSSGLRLDPVICALGILTDEDTTEIVLPLQMLHGGEPFGSGAVEPCYYPELRSAGLFA
ncbi:unnamed protein product, partial [Gulo gulo]